MLAGDELKDTIRAKDDALVLIAEFMSRDLWLGNHPNCSTSACHGYMHQTMVVIN